MKQRSNEEWLDELEGLGQVREMALEDLRAIIFEGLSIALVDRFHHRNRHLIPFIGEISQNTLARVLEKMHTFEGRSKFTTWVYKIAVHIALTELRRQRWKDVSLEEITDLEPGLFSPDIQGDKSPGSEIRTEQSEVVSRIFEIIQNDLTDKQRQAMIAITGGMPLEEVARRLNLSPNALYKLLHDARLRLKRRMVFEDLSPGEVLALFD